MTNINENWQEIKGFEGLYKISTLGNVYSYKMKKQLKPYNHNGKYFLVSLRKNGRTFYRYIHRLIAEHFIPNKDNLECVDHINNVKTDNRIENLQWVTFSLNNSKDRKNKTSKYTGVSFDKSRCKWVASIDKLLFKRFDNENDAFIEYSNVLKSLK
jgi:hypothetical protein